MVPEDKFEILNAAAWRAACKFNKNPEDQQDCYDFVLYHAALKIGEEHNANYMRMRCDSLARIWRWRSYRSVCAPSSDPRAGPSPG